MICVCKECGYSVEFELWPWHGFLCDSCQEKADRAMAARIDVHMHSAYLSHLAHRMMR